MKQGRSVFPEQIKVTVSPELKSLVRSRAEEIGIPVSQYVKNLIINDVKQYPTYQASAWTEQKTKAAMENME